MDYYAILNVTKTATQDEIKKQYHILAKQYHPDKCNGNNEQFIQLNTAHETLSDPIKRDQYDNISENDVSIYDKKNKLYDLFDEIFLNSNIKPVLPSKPQHLPSHPQHPPSHPQHPSQHHSSSQQPSSSQQQQCHYHQQMPQLHNSEDMVIKLDVTLE